MINVVRKSVILLGGLVSFVALADNHEAVSSLIEEGQEPKPILETLVGEGTPLERATALTVSSSSSSSYAQGFTHYAICMSLTLDQAERVHDIAMEAASDGHRDGVEAEARYTLTVYKNDGCEVDEAVVQDDAAPSKEEVADASNGESDAEGSSAEQDAGEQNVADTNDSGSDSTESEAETASQEGTEQEVVSDDSAPTDSSVEVDPVENESPESEVVSSEPEVINQPEVDNELALAEQSAEPEAEAVTEEPTDVVIDTEVLTASFEPPDESAVAGTTAGGASISL